MQAFVTGGSGFLGGRLIRALADRGDRVAALARSDHAAAAVTAAGAADVVRGDLDAVEAMTAAMAGCEVVFHCAAKVTDWGDPAEFERINVTGTDNVIAAARAAGVPRMVHVSTEAVLTGTDPLIDADESWPRPSRPIGLYSRTKAEAEQRVVAANGNGLDTVVVRPRFVWGAGDTSVLAELVDAVESGRFRWISGGRYLTSTCHVDNVVEGMLLGAERGGGGEIYFLTDGEPVELRAFLTELLATQGVEPDRRSIPRVSARFAAWMAEAVWRLFRLRGRPPATRQAVRLIGGQMTVDDGKARRELGYQARVSREDGLAELRAQSSK